MTTDEIGSVCRVFRYATALAANNAWEQVLRRYRHGGTGISGQRFGLDVEAGVEAAVYVAVLGEEDTRSHVERAARILARTAIEEVHLPNAAVDILRNKRRRDILTDNGSGHVTRYGGGVPMNRDGIALPPRRQG